MIERSEERGPRRREPASATAASWAAPRAQLVRARGLGAWRPQSRDARATGGVGSRGATVARAHDRLPFRARCNRRDAARVGGSFSRCTPTLARAGAAGHLLLACTCTIRSAPFATGAPRRGRETFTTRCTSRLARAGAAGHRLRALYVHDSQLVIRNGCGAARVARGSRDALRDSRGGEPRRDRCSRCTINSRSSHFATGVTRRGWAGVRGGSARSSKRSGMRRRRSGVVLHAGARALRVSLCVHHPVNCSTSCRLRSSGEARIVRCEMICPDGGVIRRGRC